MRRYSLKGVFCILLIGGTTVHSMPLGFRTMMYARATFRQMEKEVSSPFVFGEGDCWTQQLDGSWKSGVTAHNATNSISMPVSGAGTIAFNWKTSCEGFYRTHRLDYLAFFIDGSEQDFINDETGWKAVEFNVVGSGDHTLTWSYIKDSEGTAGQDCAWLRDVTWTPADVSVDIGGGKSVTVPGTWIAEHENLVRNNGGSVSAALASTAANGRMSVAECYVVGVDPEKADEDFKITSFPMKADGTPDLENIVFDPPEARWNVSGARPVVKGAAALGGEWQTVTEENKASFRFFKVEVVLP